MFQSFHLDRVSIQLSIEKREHTWYYCEMYIPWLSGHIDIKYAIKYVKQY